MSELVSLSVLFCLSPGDKQFVCPPGDKHFSHTGEGGDKHFLLEVMVAMIMLMVKRRRKKM